MASIEPPRGAPTFEPLEPPQVAPRPPAKSPSRKGNPAPDAAVPAPSPPAVPVKPLQNAVAVTYQSKAGVPKVVAKGRGLIAEQIIARAREHGVFVHESKELVALLMQVELDDQIPPALYRAVAELLAWLYRIEAARTPGGKVS